MSKFQDGYYGLVYLSEVQMKKIELLAPAGDEEALKAAKEKEKKISFRYLIGISNSCLLLGREGN